jgi:UDP-glucose 4-epimerase
VTYLVTGATGFVGQALLPRLAERGEVVALCRPDSDADAVDGVHWVGQDLSRPLDESGLPERVDAVFHLAQSARYREFPDGAQDMLEVNTASTLRLLEYCRRAGGQSFVLASTGAIYASGPEPVTETDAPQPGNFYAASKLAAEQIAGPYGQLLHVHVLRPFFVYGPGQQADRFIPGLIRRVREGQPVTLAGDDGIRLNPVYVDDAVEALLGMLALGDSETLNVAGPGVHSIREITQMIGSELGATPDFEVGEPQADLVASIERLSERLGAPTVSMPTGIARTVAAAP